MLILIFIWNQTVNKNERNMIEVEIMMMDETLGQ